MHKVILAILCATFFLLACRQPTRVATPAGNAKTLRVMTFNVNFGMSGDIDSLAAIRESGADLVLLQETNAAWEKQIRGGLSEMYPHMAFRHCCGAGGLAILSKGKFVEDRYLDERNTSGGWFPAWYHVVETPVGQVQTLNVHLHPPLSDSGSVVWGYFSTPSIRRKEIKAYFAALPTNELPTIVAGDFNEAEDGGAVQFLHKRGLTSALPEFHPGADTWRWSTSVGSIHSQLDHVVYDPRLIPINANVVKRGHSDHWPIVTTFIRNCSTLPKRMSSGI